MNIDALRTALRLREQSRDAAAEDVARCLVRSEQARVAARAADERIAREMEAAVSLDAGDGAVEAFAAWLPVGRNAAAAAEEASQDTEAALTVARAGLAVARACVEAVEGLLAGIAEQADARVARVERAAAEDALSRPAREEVA